MSGGATLDEAMDVYPGDMAYPAPADEPSAAARAASMSP
jgi:hypothetical protein